MNCLVFSLDADNYNNWMRMRPCVDSRQENIVWFEKYERQGRQEKSRLRERKTRNGKTETNSIPYKYTQTR